VSDYHNTHWVTFYKCSVFSASSAWVSAFFVIWHFIILRCVQFKVLLFCFVNAWMILIMSDGLVWVLIVADDIDTEWDDGCPGLIEILAREVEWEEWEVHNDVEALRGYLSVSLPSLSSPPLSYTPLSSPTLTPVHMYTPPLSVP
jgi:hypothetical protein